MLHVALGSIGVITRTIDAVDRSAAVPTTRQDALVGSVLLGAAAVVFLNLYAAALVVLRARVWHLPVYRPMLVNIGLSFAPVLAALVLPSGFLATGALVGTGGEGPPLPVLVGGLWLFVLAATAVWLLAFPNSAYLITELNLSHRRDDDPVPLWYDIVATLTLTVSGLANAVLGLGIIQFSALLLADANSVPVWSWAGVAVVLVLGAFGIYLGRYVRLNSWDVRHPVSLAGKVRAHLGETGVGAAAGFVATHALLLAAIYVPLFVLARSSLTP